MFERACCPCAPLNKTVQAVSAISAAVDAGSRVGRHEPDRGSGCPRILCGTGKSGRGTGAGRGCFRAYRF